MQDKMHISSYSYYYLQRYSTDSTRYWEFTFSTYAVDGLSLQDKKVHLRRTRDRRGAGQQVIHLSNNTRVVNESVREERRTKFVRSVLY